MPPISGSSSITSKNNLQNGSDKVPFHHDIRFENCILLRPVRWFSYDWTQYLICPILTFQNSFDRESDHAKDNSELFVPNNEEKNLDVLSSNVSVSSYLNKIEGMKSNEHEVNQCNEKNYFQLCKKICSLNDIMILFSCRQHL